MTVRKLESEKEKYPTYPSPKIKILGTSGKKKEVRRFEESREARRRPRRRRRRRRRKGNPHRSEKYGFYLENVRWKGGLDNCVINYSFYPAGPCRFGEGQPALTHFADRAPGRSWFTPATVINIDRNRPPRNSPFSPPPPLFLFLSRAVTFKPAEEPALVPGPTSDSGNYLPFFLADL